VPSFENLPSWLSRSSNAIWTSFVSGSLGICLAVAKALLHRYDSRPNYLVLIGITTVTMLVLVYLLPLVFNRNRREAYPAILMLGIACVGIAVVFLLKENGSAGTVLLAAGMIFVLVSQGFRVQIGPFVIEVVQPSQVLPPQALVEHQQAATKELSDQIERSHLEPLNRNDVEKSVAHLIKTFAGEGYLALTPPRNDIDLGTVLIKQDGRFMEVARAADIFGVVPTETASAPAIHDQTNGVVLDCAPIVNNGRISSLTSPAKADFLQRLTETERGSELFVVAGTIGCQDLKVNGVELGERLTLAVKLAKLSPGK
jgi:hypothetical protein